MRARRRWRRGDRPRRPGPRLVRPRHRRARFARAAAAPAGPPRRAARARPVALPVPERGPRPVALDDARARDRRPVLRPLAAARVRAAAAQHEAVGKRRPVRRPHRPHPRERAATPRSARRSSSGSRARPRPTTTSCSGSCARSASTGPASSRSRPRTARRRRRATSRSPRSWPPSGCASAVSSRIRSRRRRATRWSVRRSRCSSTGSTPETDALIGRTHREAPEIDGLVRVTGRHVRPARRPGLRARHGRRGPGSHGPRDGGDRGPRGVVSSPAVPTKRFGPGCGRDPGELHHDRPPAVRGPDADPHRA